MPSSARFIGARLRQGRIVRGLTATALAERLGVAPVSVSRWERKGQQPRGDLIAAICRELALPQAFFTRPMESDASAGRFRSMSAASKRARDAVMQQSSWLHEIAEAVGTDVELPSVNLPTLDVPDNPTMISEEVIESAAEALRSHWRLGLGPVDNALHTIESNGIVASRFAFGCDRLDGLSIEHGGRPYVLLNSEFDAHGRSRFDAFHEIGHLVLHTGAPSNPGPSMYRLMEDQAHRFAGAALFPRESFYDEVVTLNLDALIDQKTRWGMSVGAIVRRAGDLGLLSEKRIERVWRNYSSRGWRRREPLDDETECERPSLLREAYELMVSEGAVSRGEILTRVPVSQQDHERLAALRPGFMSPDYGRVHILTLPERSPPSTKQRGPEAEVIRIRSSDS